MSGRSFGELARDIKSKWGMVERSLYWGDNLDVRYYLCHRLRELRGKKILDIGCGPGIVLSVLDDSNDAYGLDIVPDNIRYSKKFNPRGQFLIGDMHRLPFREGAFDVVLFNAMLPLARDKAQMIAGLCAVLKPGGRLFLTTHNRNYYEYKREPSLPTIPELEGYLKPYFEYSIAGFNPLPRYPFFVPNILIDKIPFIWYFIMYLSKRNFLSDKSCGIYVEAVKKKA
jgi:SAM-dependent methyltransferase